MCYNVYAQSIYSMLNLRQIQKKLSQLLPRWQILLSRPWGQGILILALAAGLVGFLILAKPSLAADGWQEYIWGALAYIIEAIASLIVKLLLFVIHFIIVLSGYNNFLDARVVSIGWSLTRDVANMFFILIMLIIAFGTMLKVEQYSWKRLLPGLVMMAVLVNFSKTIIGLFIDFAQVIMLTFVNGYAAAAGGNFVQMFALDKVFKVAADTGPIQSVTFSALVGFLLGTILLGVALIVTSVFAAILLFRIITLWVLIVLSPIAFLLKAFPAGQQYYSQWSKQLTSSIIVGPIIAFFLWLSLAAMGGSDQYSQLTEDNAVHQDILNAKTEQEIGKPVGEAGKEDTSEVAKWENLGAFAVSIAMLFVALQMTQQLGVAGSGLAGSAAGWMKSKATEAVKKAPKWGLKKGWEATEAARKPMWLALSRVPGMRMVAARRAGAIEAGRVARAEQKIKGVQYLPLKDQMRLAGTWKPILPVNKIAKSAMMEKMLGNPAFDTEARKQWEDEAPKKTSAILEDYKKLAGTDEKKLKQIFDFQKENPDLVSPIEDEVDAEGKVIKKGRRSVVQSIKTDEITKVSAAAFKDDEVVRAMNDEQRRRLILKGSQEQRGNYNETLRRIGAAGGGPPAAGLMSEQLVEEIAENRVSPEKIAQVQLSDELLDKVVSDYPLDVGVKIAGVQTEAFNKRMMDIKAKQEGASTSRQEDEKRLNTLQDRQTSLKSSRDLQDFGDYDKYQEMKGRKSTFSAGELIDFRDLEKRYKGFDAQQAGLDAKRQRHGELEAKGVGRNSLEQREMRVLEGEIKEGKNEGKRLEHARSAKEELSSVDKDITATQKRVEEHKVAEKSSTEQLAKIKNVLVGAAAEPQGAFKQLDYNPAAGEGKGKFEGSAEQQKASQEALANVLKTLSEPPPWVSNLKVEVVVKKLPDGKIAGLTELGRILTQNLGLNKLLLLAQRTSTTSQKNLAAALIGAKKASLSPDSKEAKKLEAPAFDDLVEAIEDFETNLKGKI